MKPSNKNGISLIIHTKNEEKNIRDCILSAKEVANEIIVIDQSSTDRTVEVAKSLGATVYRIPDEGFIDNFRNFGISKTKFKWALALDADERLTRKLSTKIKKMVKDNEYDVVVFPFKNIRLGKWMQHTGWWPDYHPRLFRKGYLKWPTNIAKAHIQPIIKGNILTLDAIEKNAILHHNVTSMQSLLSKMTRYYFLEDAGGFFEKNKMTPQTLINYYEGEFKYRYIEERGYLDGMRGFVFSKFREYAKFLEFVKWWESNRYPEIFDQEGLFKIISDDFENKNELRVFKSSKTFKAWRAYCRFKDYLKKIMRI